MNPTFENLLIPFLPYLNGNPITEESRLHDLGLNSMKAIDLLFTIEDELGVALPDEDLNDATFTTAGALWSAVRRAGAGAGTGDSAGTGDGVGTGGSAGGGAGVGVGVDQADRKAAAA